MNNNYLSKKRKLLIYISAILIFVLILVFLFYYKHKIVNIIMPFLIAGIIAYLINPLVLILEKRKVSRSISIIIIYFIVIIVIASLIIFIIPQVINNAKDLMNTLPSIALKYRDLINRTMSAIEESRWTPDVKEAISLEIQNAIDLIEAFIMSVLKKSLTKTIEFLTALFDMILAMIIAYYFIKDAEIFKETFFYLSPKKWRNGMISTCREINSILSNFIQGQLLTALIISVLESTGLYLINLKYPLVLGIVGGIANIIPYFGPIIGAIPALAVALIQSPMKTVWTAAVFIIVQQIDNAFISPKIIEGKLGLHPVTTILAVLVGGEFFGIIGMLVSVPILAIIKIVLKRLIEAIV